MGNDGEAILHIRGSPDELTEISNTRAAVTTEDEPVYFQTLREDYFAKAKYNRCAPNYLTIRYPFRNQPCIDYLTTLLTNYPSCWMKNEFDSEEGLCGVWIAQIKDGRIQSQEHTWMELCMEEMTHVGLKT
jgi:hypothetical protein